MNLSQQSLCADEKCMSSNMSLSQQLNDVSNEDEAISEVTENIDEKNSMY